MKRTTIMPVNAANNDRRDGLDHSCFSFIISCLRMVKWKLVTIVFLCVLLLLTYLTDHQVRKHDHYQTILVFLHIQKTAGSEFDRAIGRQLSFNNKSSCTCPSSQIRRSKILWKCNCIKNGESWLISRFSTGWLCGVHADWTTYHRCLAKKIKLDYGSKKRKYDKENTFS